MRFATAALIVWLGALGGCASVRFYDDKPPRSLFGSEHETGFEFFMPKPYLLVVNTKDGPQVSVVSLPNLDKDRRRYVQYREGWGTAEMAFTVEHGIIKSFNQKTDSKGPETVTALTGAAGGVASILSAPSAASSGGGILEQVNSQLFSLVGEETPDDGSEKAAWASHASEPYEIKPIKSAHEKLVDALTEIKSYPELKSSHTEIESINTKLANLITIPANLKYDSAIGFLLTTQRSVRGYLSRLSQEVAVLSKAAETGDTPLVPWRQAALRARTHTEKALAALIKFASPTKKYELYEILPGSRFRPVIFGG